MYNTTKKGSIGTDNSGIIGIYGTKVVLRPQLDASTKGVEVTSDAMYPTASMTLGTDSKKWSTVYATTFNGNATNATTTANTSDSIYPVGVKSGATTILLHDTSITMKGGAISATTYTVNSHVTLQYNTTDSSLDFIFT